jgi:hypothetical protein
VGFLKITEVAQILGNLFLLNLFFNFDKNGFVQSLWAIFSQMHLVTLLDTDNAGRSQKTSRQSFDVRNGVRQ